MSAPRHVPHRGNSRPRGDQRWSNTIQGRSASFDGRVLRTRMENMAGDKGYLYPYDSIPKESLDGDRMPVEVTMPQLSDTMTEGTLVKWNKKEGDAIKSGEEIADIEIGRAHV